MYRARAASGLTQGREADDICLHRKTSVLVMLKLLVRSERAGSYSLWRAMRAMLLVMASDSLPVGAVRWLDVYLVPGSYYLSGGVQTNSLGI